MVSWVFILVGFAFGLFFGGCLVYAGLYRAARIMGKVHDAIIEGGKTAGL